VSNPGMKTCPECAEEIRLEAKVCHFCGTSFSLVEVGYCVHCHKVTATSDLGVCVVCNSRLIDVHLESLETSGPKVGPTEKEPEAAGIAPVATAAGPVMPILAEEPDTAENVVEETPAEPEPEPELAEPVAIAFEAEEVPPEPEGVSIEPDTVLTEPEAARAEPEEAPAKTLEPDLPPPPPAPGPPSGVVAWTRKGSTFEPVTKPAEPAAPEEEPEAEEPASVEKAPEAEEKPVPPATPSSNDVAERLAAFGRRSAPSVTPAPVSPPSGGMVSESVSPPVSPPPGPPATTPPVITPSAPAAPPSVESAAAAPRAEAVDVKTKARPEPEREPAEKEKAPEKVALKAGAGERLGIVPSRVHQIAHPLYQLAAVVVVVVWLIELYWNHSLKGTSQAGSKTLSYLAVATYGNGKTLLIGAQIAVVAIICGLLAPTRVLPRGWFRRRKVAKEFSNELKEQLGVTMILQHKWYLERMILAFVIWAIALGYFVWSVAQKTSVVLQAGGYIATVAILVGFACAAVLMLRRTPVVRVDENGKIKSIG
jgi:hypothetical protein